LKNKIHQMRNVSLAGSQGRGYQVYWSSWTWRSAVW
jgi:hypothetical protein